MPHFVAVNSTSCVESGSSGDTAAVPVRRQRQKLRVPALGNWVRTVREAKKRTQPQVAKDSGLNKSQISRLENGANVEAEQYERIAIALGFKNALEMFKAPGDPIMRLVMRYWPLLDEKAKRDVLQRVKATIDADGE